MSPVSEMVIPAGAAIVLKLNQLTVWIDPANPVEIEFPYVRLRDRI